MERFEFRSQTSDFKPSTKRKSLIQKASISGNGCQNRSIDTEFFTGNISEQERDALGYPMPPDHKIQQRQFKAIYQQQRLLMKCGCTFIIIKLSRDRED